MVNCDQVRPWKLVESDGVTRGTLSGRSIDHRHILGAGKMSNPDRTGGWDVADASPGLDAQGEQG